MSAWADISSAEMERIGILKRRVVTLFLGMRPTIDYGKQEYV